MSRRSKSTIPTAVKYLVLIIFIIILVISFKLTIKNKNGDNALPNNNNQSSPVSNNSGTKNPANSNNFSENNNQTNPEIVIGGKENYEVNQYILRDMYILASADTKYQQSGYKYFIVGSKNVFEEYITNNIQSPFDNTYSSIYASENQSKINSISEIATNDFFRTNRFILIVDYATKPIGGEVDKITIEDKNVTVNINRTINTEKTSLYNIYIVPIEITGISSINITYTKQF